MTTEQMLRSRRGFLKGMSAAAATGLLASYYFNPGVFADAVENRTRTPALTEGPFYPDHLPLDTDNDLLIVNDSLTPAVGDITHLSGKILDSRGDPVRNAVIEIWQVDHDGSYIHSQGLNHQSNKRDKNFQGYGRFLTGSTGEYYFRTIKPVTYPGRTPHIHVKVKLKGREELTTQFFVKGEPKNDHDGVFQGIQSAAARDTVLADYLPLKGSRTGELTAKVDIVLGLTPEA